MPIFGPFQAIFYDFYIAKSINKRQTAQLSPPKMSWAEAARKTAAHTTHGAADGGGGGDVDTLRAAADGAARGEVVERSAAFEGAAAAEGVGGACLERWR